MVMSGGSSPGAAGAITTSTDWSVCNTPVMGLGKMCGLKTGRAGGVASALPFPTAVGIFLDSAGSLLSMVMVRLSKKRRIPKIAAAILSPSRLLLGKRPLLLVEQPLQERVQRRVERLVEHNVLDPE